MATCEQCRKALSARMDGEEPGLPDGALDVHLTTCAGCREFTAAVGALDVLATGSAGTPPDRSADIMSVVRAERRAAQRRPQPVPVARLALGLVGIAQLLTALPFMWSLTGAHTVRDLAAFELALGVGFVVAAVRPVTAAGLLPTAAALVAILAVVVVGDVAGGRVGAGAEAAHATELVGVALLWLMAPGRTRPRPARPA